MRKVEVMVKDEDTGQSTFFFPHTSKSAYQRAEEFVNRNKGRRWGVYALNHRPWGPQWVKI